MLSIWQNNGPHIAQHISVMLPSELMTEDVVDMEASGVISADGETLKLQENVSTVFRLKQYFRFHFPWPDFLNYQVLCNAFFLQTCHLLLPPHNAKKCLTVQLFTFVTLIRTDPLYPHFVMYHLNAPEQSGLIFFRIHQQINISSYLVFWPPWLENIYFVWDTRRLSWDLKCLL